MQGLVDRTTFIPDDHEPEPPSPSTADGKGTGGQLTKVTVNLIPRAVTALEEVAEITHDTKTESINRALQLYAWAQKMIESGHSLCVVGPDGKTVTQVQLF